MATQVFEVVLSEKEYHARTYYVEAHSENEAAHLASLGEIAPSESELTRKIPVKVLSVRPAASGGES